MGNNGKKRCTIWAVAGGKGGTGKTFVINNIAIQLASRNLKTILVDADFGGPNVHTYFGVKPGPRSLTDFFEKNVPLKDVVTPTALDHLQIIPGNVNCFASEGMKHTQKSKFLRHIRTLESDYVLLDLGGGVGVNTIDTFLVADKMILVLAPESTAIENLYHFIKNIYFRKLKTLLGLHGLRHIAHEKWKERQTNRVQDIRGLIESLREQEPEACLLITEELARFRVYLVLNQVRNEKQISIGLSLRSICAKYLGIETEFVGYVEHDAMFWQNINLEQPYVHFWKSPRLTDGIGRLTDNLIEGRQFRGGRVPV